MFDVAPTELMLVAAVALVVIGPKDLPKAMRVVGRWVAKAQGVARHFRSGLDEMVRQAELEEMEKKWAEENARIMREHPPASDPAPETTPAPEMRPLAHGAPAPADLAPAGAFDPNGPTPEPHDAAIPFPADPARAEEAPPPPDLPAPEPLLPFEPPPPERPADVRP